MQFLNLTSRRWNVWRMTPEDKRFLRSLPGFMCKLKEITFSVNFGCGKLSMHLKASNLIKQQLIIKNLQLKINYTHLMSQNNSFLLLSKQLNKQFFLSDKKGITRNKYFKNELI